MIFEKVETSTVYKAICGDSRNSEGEKSRLYSSFLIKVATTSAASKKTHTAADVIQAEINCEDLEFLSTSVNKTTSFSQVKS